MPSIHRHSSTNITLSHPFLFLSNHALSAEPKTAEVCRWNLVFRKQLTASKFQMNHATICKLEIYKKKLQSSGLVSLAG